MPYYLIGKIYIDNMAIYRFNINCRVNAISIKRLMTFFTDQKKKKINKRTEKIKYVYGNKKGTEYTK